MSTSSLKPGSAVIRPVGITELPDNKKKTSGSPSIDNNDLIRHIELYGARVAWSRAAICPCQGANDQTEQPDPTCAKCQGRGFFYFGPPGYEPPAEAGIITPLQQAILDDDGGAVIRTLFTRSTHITDPYDMLGTWTRGSMFVTVRPENKIGYYDRLVNLDAEIVFTETIDVDLADDPLLANPIKLRYRATWINTLQTKTARYEPDGDFELLDTGDLQWIGNVPTPDTTNDPDNTVLRFSVHYLTHPTWHIVEYPHVFRETPNRKDVCGTEVTPFGTPTALPIQALARLEFLPKTEREEKFT